MRIYVLFAIMLLAIFQVTDAQHYKLVWADDFKKAGLPDTSKWVLETGGHGWGNNELQYYRDGTSNAIVKSGKLIITAKSDSFANNAYTSARLNSKSPDGAWTYGKIEARIKAPYGRGIWPAFWMLGSNFKQVNWPKCGEIDILESIGPKAAKGQFFGTAHWLKESGEWTSCGDSVISEKSINAPHFHKYSIVWTKEYIKWYLDDMEYHSISITDKDKAAFHKPFYIILNLAVGGRWPGYPDETTTFPQKLIIDYVRVYQIKE